MMIKEINNIIFGTLNVLLDISRKKLMKILRIQV